jgi:hypothetical protein
MNAKVIVWLMLLDSLFPQVMQAQLQWGDQGNGTYINPVLNADYSDPDAHLASLSDYNIDLKRPILNMEKQIRSNCLLTWNTA